MIKTISAILGIVISCSCFLISYVTGNLLDVVIKVVNLVVAPLFVLFLWPCLSRLQQTEGL